jgi:hypothetical protein
MSVKYSLHKHLDWWKLNVKNSYITGIIESGYKLPLLNVPKPEWLKNNRSAFDNADFVTKEIQELLNNGIVLLVKKQPTVINALTVAINADGKKRLVLDLRQVNPMLSIPSYKYKDIRVASQFFEKQCYMSIFDLKSGYHHIDIHLAYQQYLGFHWLNNFYVFSCCPFGLAAAGLVFSKVLREMVKIWRSRGYPVVMYLDDGIIVGKTKMETDFYVQFIRRDLKNAGFVVNEAKSIWVPSKQVKWLGFLLDSQRNVFEVPAVKLDRLRKGLFNNLSHQKVCSARDIAKTIGRIISLFHAFGNLVYFMTKNGSLWISERASWSGRTELPNVVVNELQFWYKNLYKAIRQPLDKGLTRYTKIIYSDASETGCGAFVVGQPGLEMVHYWTPLERLTSSTYRELRTVFLFLEVHGDKFQGVSVKWYTDNQGVPHIIRKGSMKTDLNLTNLKIFQLCLQYDIDLSIDWVPRELNTVADDLSKEQDWDDWAISDNISQTVQKAYGPFTADLFASNLTNKLPKFYSKFWCVGTSGVDAFAYDWGKEFAWVVPPPILISKVLSHVKRCQARCVLVVPKWCSAPFWPVLYNGNNYRGGISVLLEYIKPVDFFIKGLFGNSVFSSEKFASNVLILKLDFR